MFSINMFEKKIRLSLFFLIIIMIVAVGILLLISTEKEGMHVDEYYSYGLANHIADGEIAISPKCGVPLNPSEVFDSYFYADTFSLKNVWENQRVDVHPPLYYLLFHIWGLITQNFLGLKTGILLNIIFHVINIGIIYLILKEVINREYLTLLGTGFYALNPIILGNVLFIRMYVMLMTFVLLLILILLKEWYNIEIKKSFYFKMIGVSIAGTLTHYYFLIYLFFSCCVWGMKLLKSHRWKETVKFVAAMLVAAIISITIFPNMLEQIFMGNRGQESFNMLVSSIWLDNMKFFGSTFDMMSGGIAGAIFIIGALVIFCRFAVKEPIYTEQASWIGIVLIPALLYYCLVSKIVVMQATRYISPLYGSWIILLMIFIDAVTKYIDKDSLRCMAAICVIALLLNKAWKTYEWPELYPEAKQVVFTAQEYGQHNECVYVFDRIWRSMPNYQEFVQYPNITFIPDSGVDMLKAEHYISQDNIVIYFDKAIDQEQIDEMLRNIIEFSPNLQEYSKLYEYAYNVAYYLQ